jgi:hypothetical protein
MIQALGGNQIKLFAAVIDVLAKYVDVSTWNFFMESIIFALKAAAYMF